MTEQEVLEIIKLISNSLLISDLSEQTTITTDSNYLVINKGSEDAKKIKIPLLRGALGNYNASTNTPSLSNGVGLSGDTYTVSVAGSRDFGNGSINLIVDDVLWYNGTKWVKLTQTQISDIENLQTELNNKASLNGDANENFEVSGGTNPNDAVSFSQLGSVATYLNTGDSFYVDIDGKLWLNLSTYRQTINYVSGTQTFTLDFEPTFFIGVFINGVYIDDLEYTYVSPNEITILGTLESGDVIKLIYEHFVNPPNEIEM